MPKWLLVLLFGGMILITGPIGCEIDADADDDGAKLEIEAD